MLTLKLRGTLHLAHAASLEGHIGPDVGERDPHPLGQAVFLEHLVHFRLTQRRRQQRWRRQGVADHNPCELGAGLLDLLGLGLEALLRGSHTRLPIVCVC